MLSNIYPEWVSVGPAGDVLFPGCQFPATTQVKFNGTLHAAVIVDSSHIRVALSGADTAAAGTVVLTLSNAGKDFGSGVLKIVPPGVYWRFLGTGPRSISQEVQLLLMVLFTGAFGSCVYALKSLADYRGDNKLYAPWFTHYLIQPFEGAGIALLLYLVIRGGFLAGGGSDMKAVNQFGMCAIAGLAGAFSDTAFLKLREVFQTLFKPQDDRGGKIGPKITTISLPDGVVGTAYKQTLQASGVVAPLKWSVSPALPATLTLDCHRRNHHGHAGGGLAGNQIHIHRDGQRHPRRLFQRGPHARNQACAGTEDHNDETACRRREHTLPHHPPTGHRGNFAADVVGKTAVAVHWTDAECHRRNHRRHADGGLGEDQLHIHRDGSATPAAASSSAALALEII